MEGSDEMRVIILWSERFLKILYHLAGVPAIWCYPRLFSNEQSRHSERRPVSRADAQMQEC
jgi:hypothetical protein